jgi:uncharacterized protein YjaG (DUF416 family)
MKELHLQMKRVILWQKITFMRITLELALIIISMYTNYESI